jgi:HEAT repeat protein
MSLLARPSDETVIQLLQKALVAEDREVRWNAALTLARLGNTQARSPLLDMLDRDYWSKVPVRSQAANGEVVESPMPAAAVEQYLVAAVDAAANLDDVVLRESIAALRDDGSPLVASRARAALEGRGSHETDD